MSWKIVSDSSSNIFKIEDAEYTTVPLKINTEDKEYVDQEGIDIEEMLDNLENRSKTNSTSCPSTGEWLNAFEGNDEVYGVTISSNLSGSFHAAEVAKQEYLEENETAKVHIFDTKATGPYMYLIIQKIAELKKQGLNFDDIVNRVNDYLSKTKITFLLASVNNLAKNGRVSQIVAKVINVLGIRLLGKASPEGTIEVFHKSRGEKKAISDMYQGMKDLGFKGGKVIIDHVFNFEAANQLKQIILNHFPKCEVIIGTCKGLCSYYAERYGLIIGFEI